jgi:two-component sensor histidine kinase
MAWHQKARLTMASGLHKSGVSTLYQTTTQVPGTTFKLVTNRLPLLRHNNLPPATPSTLWTRVMLAFHELTTNALKYGALSTAGGSVDIGWELIDLDNQSVELIWRERGGPKVERGRTCGFGTTLIDRVLKYDLDAATEIHFDPQGLRCVVRFGVSA